MVGDNIQNPPFNFFLCCELFRPKEFFEKKKYYVLLLFVIFSKKKICVCRCVGVCVKKKKCFCVLFVFLCVGRREKNVRPPVDTRGKFLVPLGVL